MENDYTKVHRDIAAGQIAGDLIKNGYYGEDVELFGSICTLGGKSVAVYGYDQEAVALKAYAYLQKGAEITHIITKRYHLKKLHEDKAPIEADFLQLLKKGLDCENEFILGQENKFIWSGFAYNDNGTQKTVINGYFPFVLEKYLTFTEENVPTGNIEFRIFDSINFERDKIKAELKDILSKNKL